MRAQIRAAGEHDQARHQQRPKEFHHGLFVTDSHVAIRQHVQQLAIANELGKVAAASSGADKDRFHRLSSLFELIAKGRLLAVHAATPSSLAG
jgi:hypothetical protein